jgi:hypothetical protein
MNQYWVLVRLKDEPGAGVTRQYISASDPHAAIAMAKAMFGALLFSQSANLA